MIGFSTSELARRDGKSESSRGASPGVPLLGAGSRQTFATAVVLLSAHLAIDSGECAEQLSSGFRPEMFVTALSDHRSVKLQENKGQRHVTKAQDYRGFYKLGASSASSKFGGSSGREVRGTPYFGKFGGHHT